MKKFMKILGLCLALVLMLSFVSCSMLGGDDGDKKQTEEKEKDNEKKKNPVVADKIAFYDFVNESGNWCIYADGEIVGTYSTQGKLVVSGDSTFAYVIHGGDIDVLDANGSTLITEKAEEVYSLAALKVGAVYSDGEGVYAYTQEHGESLLANINESVLTTSVNDYMISADASVVVFSIKPKNNDETSDAGASARPMPADMYDNSGENIDDTSVDTSFLVKGGNSLCIWRDGVIREMNIPISPVALSDDGKILYVKTPLNELMVYDTSTWQSCSIAKANEVIAITSDGSEVVFSDEYLNTRVVTVDIKSSALSISRQAQLASGEGVCTPLAPASAGYGFDTFAGKYFEFDGDVMAEDAEESLYYVDKNYQTWRIARGEDIKTDSELKHVYCLNGRGTLNKVNFSDLNNITLSTVAENVVEYEVMASGNAYCVDDYFNLNYYDHKASVKTRIATGVSELNSYEYANAVYFQYMDNDGAMFSKDGAEPDKLTVDGKSIGGMFGIVGDTDDKKTYALAYDLSSGSVKVYYTADGTASLTFLSNLIIPGLGNVK